MNLAGLVVDTICSSIEMEDLGVNPKLKNIKLSMDFVGKGVHTFDVKSLVRFDVIAKIASTGMDKSRDIPMKRVDNILLVKLGETYLPFRSVTGMPSSSKNRKQALVSLVGPTNTKTAFLDVLLEEFSMC